MLFFYQNPFDYVNQVTHVNRNSPEQLEHRQAISPTAVSSAVGHGKVIA